VQLFFHLSSHTEQIPQIQLQSVYKIQIQPSKISERNCNSSIIFTPFWPPLFWRTKPSFGWQLSQHLPWHFGLYQRPLPEEGCSVLLPVLATVVMQRGKKSVNMWLSVYLPLSRYIQSHIYDRFLATLHHYRGKNWNKHRTNFFWRRSLIQIEMSRQILSGWVWYNFSYKRCINLKNMSKDRMFFHSILYSKISQRIN